MQSPVVSGEVSKPRRWQGGKLTGSELRASHWAADEQRILKLHFSLRSHHLVGRHESARVKHSPAFTSVNEDGAMALHKVIQRARYFPGSKKLMAWGVPKLADFPLVYRCLQSFDDLFDGSHLDTLILILHLDT